MISVVVPTYNEANYLSATLDSVADSRAEKEVIVVDAGSVDGTRELAEPVSYTHLTLPTICSV